MKNKKLIVFVSFLFILSFWIVSCTRQQVKPVVLIVSASGAYRNSIAELVELYNKEKPKVTINCNIVGSGVMKKQIEQGVPIDIYIPAIDREMDELQSLGFVIPETRQYLAKNAMVLIVPKESSLPISSFSDLTDKRVKTVALGNDKIAGGIYTKQVLNYFKIFDLVMKKGVFVEEDIRQVLKAVEAGNVDAGITYLTEAKLSNEVKIVAIAPKISHIPVISPVAVLKRCENVPEAKDFLAFLKSDRAVAIFERYGFTIIN
ncbi:molybdate ABC transporter substrate-binding protein [Aerosakkonema sp. BLCC-F2]